MLTLFALLLFTLSPAAIADTILRLPDVPAETANESPSVLDEKQREVKASFPSDKQPRAGEEEILADYAHLDPERLVPNDLLRAAVLYFDAHQSSFANRKYLTVVDFSKRSNRARMFIVNLSTGGVWAIRTTHGKGGDLDHDGYVESLGNVPGSKKSSAGFYRVAEIYQSQKFGRSIRLDGLSTSNSNVRSRAIVVHGSDYVQEADVIQGRSEGCFALAWSVKNEVVDRIAGGSLLYAAKSVACSQ